MNPYMPRPAKITEIIQETVDVKTFKLELMEGRGMNFTPGQFIMISVLGVGEAPFAIASNPRRYEHIEISVKSVGNVTKALHKLRVGDLVGVRGPLGKGFPIQDLKDKNILLIAGGTGLLGITALAWYIYEWRSQFGDVKLLYGARTPNAILRLRDLEIWSKKLEIHLTVDRADSSWKGHVGLVTSLLDIISFSPENTVAIICGPPMMLKATYERLISLNFSPTRIYVSLERQMKCGIGKCGRCMLSNGMFVCQDGPVFRCDQIPLRDLL